MQSLILRNRDTFEHLRVQFDDGNQANLFRLHCLEIKNDQSETLLTASDIILAGYSTQIQSRCSLIIYQRRREEW